MSEKYIISIDQSTQGTKAMAFDSFGTLVGRRDIPHRQIINDQGWVSHDGEEIYKNTINAVKALVEAAGLNPMDIAGVGISNQRETSLIWNKTSQKPLGNAVVWQCSRAAGVCQRVEASKPGIGEMVFSKTGLKLSPYFPAAKLAWLMENTPGAMELARKHELCFGTIDTWLVFKLTSGKAYKTDASNASRTQLFNIFDQTWDREICRAFGIEPEDLPEVCGSDNCFGYTDFEGLLERPVPIHGVLGDSHAALLGQGCLEPGMIKTTYGTGSSIMMNIGEQPVLSGHGVVTSLAWKLKGKVNYVLEGNINYTGAVISWLKDDVGLISDPGQTEGLCKTSARQDGLYLVPAFTGLGAPYWNSEAKGILWGITRTTGRAEIVRAGVECIAYQIADVVFAMCQDSGMKIGELRVDGGPTKNDYLMQFQSDILNANVLVPDCEALSGTGAAYAAGFGLGIYDERIFEKQKRKMYAPAMEDAIREKKYKGWKMAVGKVIL